MTVLATDDFNRADAGTIGANWQTGTVFHIVSNQAVPSDLTGDHLTYYVAPLVPRDHYVQAKIYVTGGIANGAGMGVAVRYSNVGGAGEKFYRIVVDKAASDNLEIASFVTGAYSLLVRFSVTWVDGDTLKVTVSGPSDNALIKVYQNGALVGQYTDTTNTVPHVDGTVAAALAYSSSVDAAAADDFEFGTLDVGALSRNVLRPKAAMRSLARMN